MTRIWHGVLAAAIAFALVGQTTLVFTTQGRSLVNLGSYFTIQSNILVLISAVLIAIQPHRQEGWFVLLRLAGLVGITITGIVYASVLAGTADFSGIEWWYDKVFHYGAPIGAMLGFFLFSPRTRFARRDLLFVVWPVVWLAYTLTRASVSNPEFPGENKTLMPVPYEFLDIQRHGVVPVLVNSVVVTALMLGIAYLYVRWSPQDARASA